MGEKLRWRHRQQDQHACPGPRDYTARNDAAEERRTKAKLLLERNFPGISQKSKPKPPEQKSVVNRKRDSVAIAGPSRLPTASPASVQEAIATEKKPKTKEDKLHELHISKIRSTAVALDSRAQVDDTREKRYFEWSLAETDAKARVEAWVGSGKWAAKPERAWVLSVGVILWGHTLSSCVGNTVWEGAGSVGGQAEDPPTARYVRPHTGETRARLMREYELRCSR